MFFIVARNLQVETEYLDRMFKQSVRQRVKGSRLSSQMLGLFSEILKSLESFSKISRCDSFVQYQDNG